MNDTAKKLADALRWVAELGLYPEDYIPAEHWDCDIREAADEPDAKRDCWVRYADIRAARAALAEYDAELTTAEAARMVAAGLSSPDTEAQALGLTGTLNEP